MPKLLTIRRLVAVLLVICFVLPLSKCTSKVDPGGQVVAVNTYTHGYDLAKGGWADIRGQNLSGGIVVMLAVFVAFFLPLICLTLGDRAQSVIHFAASFPAGYVLYGWVFLFSSAPQYGGIVTLGCWLILFVTSTFSILRRWPFKWPFNNVVEGAGKS